MPVAPCQHSWIVPEDLCGHTQRDAGAQQVGCGGVPDVVHVQVLAPDLGYKVTPTRAVVHAQAGHAAFEEQLLSAAVRVDSLQEPSGLGPEMQHPWDVGLGGGHEDLAAAEVDLAPGALEQFALAGAGVDEQVDEGAEAAVAEGEASSAQARDLVSADLDAADALVVAPDGDGGALEALGAQALLARPLVAGAECREVAVDGGGLVAGLQQGLSGDLDLLAGEIPRANAAEALEPLFQSPVVALVLRDIERANELSQRQTRWGVRGSRGHGRCQVDSGSHFDLRNPL